MTVRWIAALAMLAVFGSAGAQGAGKEIHESLVEKLDLFNLCPAEKHMDLLVDGLPEHAASIGLTTGGIRDAIEKRLRDARLYDGNAGPLIRVAIVLGKPDEGHIPFYSIELSYLRELFGEGHGLFALAETWSTGGSGQGDADSFLAHLDSYVDEFTAEYVRVRDSEACRAFRRQASPRSGG